MEHTRSGSSRCGTIDDMRQVCHQWTEDRNGKPIIAGSLFNRCILRRLSIYVTWVFVALGIRAYVATLLMILTGLAGIVLCIPHAIHMTILGGLGYFLFDLLDAVDGEIARWNKSSSTKGLYLDQMSHVLIEYPSLGVPALHYYLWTGDDLFLVLAATTMVSSVMGRTFREMLFRINAEALIQAAASPLTKDDNKARKIDVFSRFCSCLNAMPITSFPIVKARVVHITTVVAILLSYTGSAHLLVFISWFYALYCTTRTLAQIPHYYCNRVVDVPHNKQVGDYRWPI